MNQIELSLADQTVVTAMVRELAAGGRVPIRPQRGVDDTESVAVTVDGDGAVTDVEIAADWRDLIPADRFPETLMATYSAALGEVTHGAVLRMLATRRHHADAPRADGPRPGPPPPEPPPTDPAERARIFADEHAAAVAARERAARVLAAPDRPDRRVPSHAGLLTAILRGGSMVGIAGDLRRIASASTTELQLDAFRLLSVVTAVPADPESAPSAQAKDR